MEKKGWKKMNMQLGLRDNLTGQVLENATVADVEAFWRRWHLDKSWNHKVLDAHGQDLPYYFSGPHYCMKHRDGAFFGKWYTTPGEAFRAFKTCKEYRDAEGREEGSFASMLDLKQWRRVDQKNRTVIVGIDKNWTHTIPNEAGKFALINRASGQSAAILNSRNQAWMKSPHAVFMFVKQNCFPKKGTIVVESMGDGKWRFREEMDPFSGL